MRGQDQPGVDGGPGRGDRVPRRLEIDVFEWSGGNPTEPRRASGQVVGAGTAFRRRAERRDERKRGGEELRHPSLSGDVPPIEPDLGGVGAGLPGGLDLARRLLGGSSRQRRDQQGAGSDAHRSSIDSSTTVPRWRAGGKGAPNTRVPALNWTVASRSCSPLSRTVSASWRNTVYRRPPRSASNRANGRRSILIRPTRTERVTPLGSTAAT